MNWYKIARENWYIEEVAKNPNTSPDILRKILEKGNGDWVSISAASNPNCPPDALKIVMERGESDIVSIHAAENPNCPPDALKMVLEEGRNDPASWNAAENPNCPPETLKMVLEREKDDTVSYWTTRNPNCPPLAKIQWMRMTGQIGTEDPAKHIIEYDEKDQKPDKDLQILRDMVSFSLKNYRIAQENWYTPGIASNPNTSPDILRKILEEGNNDNVSQWTVINPNCPPDALKMVLERENDDDVSSYAASNPNCPPEVLRMVLERGKNDMVSSYVAANPNCPPDALAMVLERRKDDAISYWTAKNPNCPLLAKINWMRATGQIGTEDPAKHIIEKEVEKEDKDLQILRDMVSFNLKNYKIAQEKQPIKIIENGNERWELNGMLHRNEEDGPAFTSADGYRAYYQHGRLHRKNGPAAIFPNGDCVWWLNGKCHREEGPAFTSPFGARKYYLDDIEYTEEEFNKEIESRKLAKAPKPLKATPEEILDFERNYIF